jgi:heme/copper-type cytochrome/quinol oxidase subunit 2
MDAALFGFQIAEILDSIWAAWCIFLLVTGVGLWLHATYVREDEDENR